MRFTVVPVMFRLSSLLVPASAVWLAGCATQPVSTHAYHGHPVSVSVAKSLADGGRLHDYVLCIATHLVTESPRLPVEEDLHVLIRDDPRINAVTPGAHSVELYIGLIDITDSDDQLAAVIAHELAHQILGHPVRRRSMAYVSETSDLLANSITDAHGQDKPGTTNAIKAALNTGLRLASWPHRRSQETAADRLGMDLVAAAGFDPVAGIDLWTDLNAMNDYNRRPAYSPHPSAEKRVRSLQKHLPHAQKIYRRRVNSNETTQCYR